MKLLILDKDGTLTRPMSGGTFVQHPEDQELINGVAETLQRYRDEGAAQAADIDFKWAADWLQK